MGECLVRFYDNTYWVEHDDLDIKGTEALHGDTDKWQHSDCGPQVSEAALLKILDIDPVAVVGSPDPSITAPSGDGGIGIPPLFPLLLGIGLFAAAGWKVFRWQRDRRPRTIPELQRWKDRVVIPGALDSRVSFSDKQKAFAVKRAGGRCEWLDRNGERCTVLHGVNGVRLHGDHLWPRSKGGLTVMDNCGALCHTHNVGAKSNKVMPDAWFLAVFANRTMKARARGALVKDERAPRTRSADIFWEDLAA